LKEGLLRCAATLDLVDYELEFLGRIDAKTINWVVRAAGLDQRIRCTLTLRPGPRILRAPVGAAAGIDRGIGRVRRVGLRRGRTLADGEVLHAAGECGARPLRRMVQSRVGAPEVGSWEQAAEAYREAIQLRSNSCEAHTNLGIVREQLGDSLGARASYDRAIKSGGESLAPRWNIALLLEHFGQLEEAERYYKQVLDRAPKD
jgi:tetratricopeptide (TPR) repeat protein